MADDILPPESIPKDGDDSIGTWSRAPKHVDMKARVALVVALRAEGLSYPEITEQTGLTKSQIGYCMQQGYVARIQEAQIQHRLDNVALPLAVDRLIEILSDDAHTNHYTAIRDTLYGRGEFRNHSHSVNDNRNVNLNLTVEYEMAQGAPLPEVVQVTEATGMMVGKPREDQADADAPRY